MVRLKWIRLWWLLLPITAWSCGGGREAIHKKMAQIAVWEDQGWTANGRMTAFLSDRNEAVRERAVLALGRANDTLALDSLRRVLLADPSSRVRTMAAFSLSAWTWQVGKGALLESVDKEKDPVVLVSILQSLARAYARDEYQRWLPLIHHPDPAVRAQAVLTWDMVNLSNLADSIVPILDDPDVFVRRTAMFALTRSRSKAAAAWALAHCHEADPEVRALAQRLSGSVYLPDARDTLLNGLDDPDPNVRMAAADALALYRDTTTTAKALPYLEKETDLGVLQRLARALGEQHHPLGMETLQKLLEHPNSGIRAQAVQALCSRRDPLCSDWIAPAAKDPDPRVRLTFLETIDKAQTFGGRIDTAVILPLLRLMSHDPMPRVRARAVQSYVGIGAADAAVYLDQLYHDSSSSAVAIAVSLIGSMHVRGYVDSLYALYPRYADDPNPDVKWAITAASANLLPSIEIDAKRQDIINWGLADPNRLVRWYTIAVAFKFRQDRRDGLGVYQTDLNVNNVDSLLPTYRKFPLAHLETTQGSITIRLSPDWAPRTVRQFMAIARSGAYDRSPVNDWQAGQMVQLGDRRGDAGDLPPARVRDEFSPLRMETGSVFWAIQTRDAGRGTFAILLRRAPYQDWRFAVFGQVVDGLDRARLLTLGDSIRTVTIEIPES